MVFETRGRKFESCREYPSVVNSEEQLKSSTPKENSQMLAQEIDAWGTEVYKAYVVRQLDLEDSSQLRQSLKTLKGLVAQLERRIK